MVDYFFSQSLGLQASTVYPPLGWIKTWCIMVQKTCGNDGQVTNTKS